MFCCSKEISFRSDHNRIHVLEATDATVGSSLRLADPSRMVSEYKRIRDSSGYSLRSLSDLEATVSYLLYNKDHIWNNIKFPSKSICYEYVMDRLRAVNQELTIQMQNFLSSAVFHHLLGVTEIRTTKNRGL